MTGETHGGGDGSQKVRGPGELQLSVPGTYEAIAAARGSLARWLQVAGVKPRTVSEMALVLTEICNNAVEHGSASAGSPIALTALITNGEVIFEVIEGAAEVKPIVEGLLAACTPPDETSERGRGFFLIRAYVDDLQVDTTPQGKLRIRFRKRVQA